MEFKGKNVLLVDDSIVRGTTSREIVQMAREAGANKVFFASASPPVRFPNVYGIDMPSAHELIATGRTHEEIAREIGADCLIYQDLDALVNAVRSVNPKVTSFETSCFSGEYVTGDVTPEYLAGIEAIRNDIAAGAPLQYRHRTARSQSGYCGLNLSSLPLNRRGAEAQRSRANENICLMSSSPRRRGSRNCGSITTWEYGVAS